MIGHRIIAKAALGVVVDEEEEIANRLAPERNHSAGENTGGNNQISVRAYGKAGSIGDRTFISSGIRDGHIGQCQRPIRSVGNVVGIIEFPLKFEWGGAASAN